MVPQVRLLHRYLSRYYRLPPTHSSTIDIDYAITAWRESALTHFTCIHPSYLIFYAAMQPHAVYDSRHCNRYTKHTKRTQCADINANAPSVRGVSPAPRAPIFALCLHVSVRVRCVEEEESQTYGAIMSLVVGRNFLQFVLEMPHCMLNYLS